MNPFGDPPTPSRRRRTLLSLLATLAVVAAGLTGAFGAGFTADAPVSAATGQTIKVSNHSGETVWVGAWSDPGDGSQPITDLPVLRDGQSATLTVPAGPGFWRGRIFPRQGCTGESGSTFHCAVANCGNRADVCTTGGEISSLAEFFFSAADTLAPWYNVSYVDAVTLPITINPVGAPKADGQHCGLAGCDKPMLSYCPAADLTADAQGKPLICRNPSRDVQTDYSTSMKTACPRAYAYSHQDQEKPNQTMYTCPECTGLEVAFHSNSAAGAPAQEGPPSDPPVVPENQPDQGTGAQQIVSDGNQKCLDVPNGNFTDGVKLIVHDCWNGPMQRWTLAGDGTVRIAQNLCLDVAWGSVDDGARIQIAWCSGNPAQQWVLSEAGDLVNPQADKCLDVKDDSRANGAALQLWTCTGRGNQKWHLA